MTREDFRRELGDSMDSISGSPDPALSERVRAALVEAPEQRGPVWAAALAAAVIAVILVGVLLVGNPLNRPPATSGNATGIPTTSPAPSPSPNPSPTASPAATQFTCGASSSFTGHQPPPTFIDGIRTGTHAGYDRLTIEFQNGRPNSIVLTPKNSATFTPVGGRVGSPVTLAGHDGLNIRIFSTDAHTAYSGPRDIKTGYSGLLEVRVIDDFEGSMDIGLGLSKAACYHAFILTTPTRLVIDIRTN
jgi:hypothetical protein